MNNYFLYNIIFNYIVLIYFSGYHRLLVFIAIVELCRIANKYHSHTFKKIHKKKKTDAKFQKRKNIVKLGARKKEHLVFVQMCLVFLLLFSFISFLFFSKFFSHYSFYPSLRSFKFIYLLYMIFILNTFVTCL